MKKNRDGSVTRKSLVHTKHWMNIPWMLDEREKRAPKQVAIERQVSLGTWSPMTVAEFQADIRVVARGFVGEGLAEGDSIAIFAATSYNWNLIDMAALSAGLVVVPIYESDSAQQVRWILEDANVKYVITETEAQKAVVESVATPELMKVISFAGDAISHLYAAAADVDNAEIDRRKKNLTMDSLATVIYTSGTTGNPKGVELTHGNFVSTTLEVHKFLPTITMSKDTRVLFFLPMAHVMARVVFYFIIAGNGVAGHAPNIKSLVADITSFKPTALLVVPRVLEKIYNAAETKAGGGIKRKIFRWAAQVAVDSSSRHAGPFLTLKVKLARKLVWSKITDVIGEQVDWAVSAGAPLGKRLGHFYRGIGLKVLEAYGLTEATGATSVNPPKAIRMGTVGLPMPGTSYKIADDGEVMIKGPHLFRGYRNNQAATDAVFDSEGWFHTGDIGELDKANYLTITGRKKELLVTAGGKNVSPAVLEDPLRSHPLISQIVAIGDQRPFVSALITLDADMLPGWLAAHGLETTMDMYTAAKHPAVLESLGRAIDKTNKQVSRAESIRKFSVLPTDFTVENGLLTPSLKVKRAEVNRRFAPAIEKLYSGSSQADKSKK